MEISQGQTLDEVMRVAQTETECLREIIRQRDLTITALKAHALCMRTSFKEILTAVIDRVIDDDVQFHAKKMIETLDSDPVAKLGVDA